MSTTFLSSGDLIIDRRAQYAQMLSDGGDDGAAADLMAQALEAAPNWAAGWMMLGTFAFAAGDLSEAVTAWRRAAELDPSGALGAQMHLAAHGGAPIVPDVQAAYVETLFDQYAEHFEASLLQKLDYVVPERLFAMIAGAMGALGLEGFARGIDLGCGTGLMGERLRRLVSHLVGVDLSAAMVEETRNKGVYDGVERAELLGFLDHSGRVADIVTAADVFMYCPALPPIFAVVARVLRDGGLFAFSVERYAGPQPQVLRESLRFAHSEDAITDALIGVGLEIVSIERDVIRQDRGQPVDGLLFVVRKPLAAAVSTLVQPVIDGEPLDESVVLN